MSTDNILRIEADSVIFESPKEVVWSIGLSQIKVIAEYTTTDGPWADDWFIVFLTERSDQWFQVPVSAKIDETFWAVLCKRLGCETPCLFASTSWASNVIYPHSLNGRELFEVIREDVNPKTFWQKFFGRKNSSNQRLKLTQEVKKLLE